MQEKRRKNRAYEKTTYKYILHYTEKCEERYNKSFELEASYNNIFELSAFWIITQHVVAFVSSALKVVPSRKLIKPNVCHILNAV